MKEIKIRIEEEFTVRDTDNVNTDIDMDNSGCFEVVKEIVKSEQSSPVFSIAKYFSEGKINAKDIVAIAGMGINCMRETLISKGEARLSPFQIQNAVRKECTRIVEESRGKHGSEIYVHVFPQESSTVALFAKPDGKPFFLTVLNHSNLSFEGGEVDLVSVNKETAEKLSVKVEKKDENNFTH